jgi:hypothetical protein
MQTRHMAELELWQSLPCFCRRRNGFAFHSDRGLFSDASRSGPHPLLNLQQVHMICIPDEHLIKIVVTTVFEMFSS